MDIAQFSPDPNAREAALDTALQLMRPFARLLIAQGLKYGEAAEALKRSFVEAARSEAERAGGNVNVSRISVSTGLHRQDVKRLLEAPTEPIEHGRSLAAEVYTRWLTDADYRQDGVPLALPMRAGSGKPSFEALARSVSTDVHPRTIAAELRRLGLVESDSGGDVLNMSASGFVPINERSRLLGLLGDNVGDHLATAVGNVLGDLPRTLEQSVYADGLDEASVSAADDHARKIWTDAMQALVPALEALIESASARRDQLSDSSQAVRSRVRIGMYLHSETIPSRKSQGENNE